MKPFLTGNHRAIGSQRSAAIAPPRPGFALIVTMTMMGMVVVLALGLLALAAGAGRSVTSSRNLAQAQANARLAARVAIGQLQKAAGPDQRVSAPANLVAASASPAFTGVWESQDQKPNRPHDAQPRKRHQTTPEADGEFVRWLVSSPDESVVLNPSQPPTLSGRATLVGSHADASGGATPAPGVTVDPVVAGKTSEIAWAVLDEGVKARFDLPPPTEPQDRLARLANLRAPVRNGVEFMEAGLEGLKLDAANAAKLVTLEAGSIPAERSLAPYFHDLTPWSASLPVNVVEGGIKADLTRAFEAAQLPKELAGRRIYSGTSKPTVESDPLFSNLAAYYKLYDQTKGATQPVGITLPANYQPVANNAPNLESPDGNLIAPVVSRVQVVFSLVSHEAHTHWWTTIPNATGDPQRKYMVYLIYTPVVTVYNPYNAPLKFSNMKVTFKYLPIGLQFFRSGKAQTNSPGLLSMFHILSQNTRDWEDLFSVTLNTQPGAAAALKEIVLNPGEARIFGVNWPAGTTWDAMTNYLWTGTLDVSKTKTIVAGPGWDYRTGFIVDWLCPSGAGWTADAVPQGNGVFGVRGDDTINVAVTPMVPPAAKGQFSVEIEASVGGKATKLGMYQYIYGTEAKLQEALANGNNPLLGKVKFPFKREKDWALAELHQPNFQSVPVEKWTGPRQFAVFTLTDRTAQDSLYAGKPVRQASFVHHVVQMDINKAHPGQMPMEVSLLPIETEGANTVGSIDADEFDRAYFFSGTRQLTGTLNFPSYQIPASPVVNLADFRHANLANSGHFPFTTYTVGESLASAWLAPDKAWESGSFGYGYADHTWLANKALWDRFYLSAIRTEAEAKSFFAGARLPIQPRFSPWPAGGESPGEAAGRATADDGWARLGARQMVRGGFNVHSTSVRAWKSVLSSLHGASVPVLDPQTHKETMATGAAAPLPRMQQPLAPSIDAAGTPGNDVRWAGFRDLEEKKVDRLAKAIVDQIRQRGPFLSMSEFVNRRLADDGARGMATGGALEMAIRNAAINDIPKGPVVRELTTQEASGYGFRNPEAASGDTEEGSAAYLTQGDLMSALGSFATVRSDTFLVRCYGAVRDASGKQVVAKAWCEAVVQRVPDFVDAADPADKVQAMLTGANNRIGALSTVNQRFGRRFQLVSFRWLDEAEL